MVQVCHTNQQVLNWEFNFFAFAQSAIDGDATRYLDHTAEAVPALTTLIPHDTESALEAWSTVVREKGPIVFDKSPYLTRPQSHPLLEALAESNHDVRFIGLVRDPRDVIASQHEHWDEHDDTASITRREIALVEGYRWLKRFSARTPVCLIRYEDLAAAPCLYANNLFRFAGLDPLAETWQHLSPINIGRHRSPKSQALREWQPSEELTSLLVDFGYEPGEERPFVS